MSWDQHEKRLRAQLSRVLNVRAEALRSEWYGTLERSRIGAGTHWPGQRNPSSAPGDPPARQTGRLMESIRVLTRATPLSLEARVGPDPKVFPDAYYPALLEYGTRTIKPRPHARPAVDSFKKKTRGLA